MQIISDIPDILPELCVATIGFFDGVHAGHRFLIEQVKEVAVQLGEDPYIGTNPRYSILRRQGYKVLILEKNLVFYKIDEVNKQVVVYAVIDQRQDYLNIIQGL